MIKALNTAIEHSDLPKAKKVLKSLLDDGQWEPWFVHESIFPVVHRVLNPPFINPHLPKMYAINRELAQYLDPADLASLLAVEIEEYTRREKLAPIARHTLPHSTTTITDIENAIANQDVSGAAIRMAAFLNTAGPVQLAKKMLLIGSGYLQQSLGHSVSCTAFILLEMINRKEQDPWPALVLLADYFCKGAFWQTPELQTSAIASYREAYLFELQRSISGSGIVALHHTITLYAIERSRHFFEPQEYDHLLSMWAEMMAHKEENLLHLQDFHTLDLPDFQLFSTFFSQYDSAPILSMAKGVLHSDENRARLGHYLVKGVLQCYNGQYNPHNLTGLGSALWIMESFSNQPIIVINALSQYLDYFFSDIS
jgi:hypothetical protein